MKQLTPEYMDLVKRVDRIDPDAACYMLLVAPGLESFYPVDELVGCFIFEDTPQDTEYWHKINEKLLQEGQK